MKRWWENYWYHYKWHTIIGLFLVVTVAVSVTQCARRETYDQSCVLYCDRVVFDSTALALEQALAKRIPDRDGNGTVAFDIYNVSYNANNTAPQQAGFSNAQKILTLVSTADYVLYAVDTGGYNRLMNQENMQLFETYDFLPDLNGTAWNWKGSVLQKELANESLPKDLYFCIRKIDNTAAQTEEEAHRRAEEAAQLIQLLMKETQ